MKVLHVINTLSAGGAELHLLTLCRYLKQHGIDLGVVCLREQVKGSRSLRREFEKENIKVMSLGADSRYAWRFLVRFLRLLREQRPDIVHTHLPRADMAGAFARLFYSYPTWICSVHAIYEKSWSARWTIPLFNLVWRQMDAVVAISRAVRDWLVMQRRIPPDKITVIHYGVETDRFRQDDTDRQKSWCRKGQSIVGSLGRLEVTKGHDCLIRAMPTIVEQCPNVSLLIAGHDPWGYGESLQQTIGRLRLKETVQLIGFQDDVVSFLRDLDVFAFASRSEGFGQVVIEAMASGKPVVASRIPPLTEIIKDGETGLLIEPDDSRGFAEAIVWLLRHTDQAHQMGKNGRQRARSQFSAQRMADQTLSLYQTLLGA